MSAKSRPEDRCVKASILIGVREHALWAACASLAGIDRSAFAVEAIMRACRDRGVHLVDRRKPKGQATLSDRPEVIGEITPDGPDSAA